MSNFLSWDLWILSSLFIAIGNDNVTKGSMAWVSKYCVAASTKKMFFCFHIENIVDKDSFNHPYLITKYALSYRQAELFSDKGRAFLNQELPPPPHPKKGRNAISFFSQKM